MKLNLSAKEMSQLLKEMGLLDQITDGVRGSITEVVMGDSMNDIIRDNVRKKIGVAMQEALRVENGSWGSSKKLTGWAAQDFEKFVHMALGSDARETMRQIVHDQIELHVKVMIRTMIDAEVRRLIEENVVATLTNRDLQADIQDAVKKVLTEGIKL